MRLQGGKKYLLLLVLTVGFLAVAPLPEVVAADNGDGWRPTYDLVMRWVNFVILAAVIIKFGRRPLMEFLDGRKEEIAYELRRLEQEKQAVMQQVAEMRQQIEASESRYEKMKERIVRQGQDRKQSIITEAQRESLLLMEGAQNHIDNRLRSARRQLRSEIIDLAVERATQQLPGMVTEEDNRNLLDKFLERTNI